jgi:hypothetical protein
VGKFLKHLDKKPSGDILTAAALIANVYLVYTQINLRSYSRLLEPLATSQITVLQASAVLTVLYLAEFMADSGEDESYHSSSSEEGWASFLSIFAENSLVEGASAVVIFLGLQTIGMGTGYGTGVSSSITIGSIPLTEIARYLNIAAIANLVLEVIGNFTGGD